MSPPVVFIHVPKAAGTTVALWLRRGFPGPRYAKGGSIFRDEGEARARAGAFAGDGRVFVGHVPLSFRDLFPPEARYVTVVREPVERSISQYFAQVRPRRRQGLPDIAPLEAAVGPGKVVPDNLQVRMLCGHDLSLDAPVPVEMLREAKNELSRFLAVGLVERFEESIVLLGRRLGLRNTLYRQERVFDRPHAAELAPETLAAVVAQNRLDLDLHAFAGELLDRALTAEGDDLREGLVVLRRARELLAVVDGQTELPPPSGPVDLAALLEVRDLQLHELVLAHARLAKEKARLAATLERRSGLRRVLRMFRSRKPSRARRDRA